MANEKPNVIILGGKHLFFSIFYLFTFSIKIMFTWFQGCGFIGRHLVEYLLDNNLVSFLRVVDKVPPQIAWLNSKHQKLFDHPLLEFVSANLINTGNISIV